LTLRNVRRDPTTTNSLYRHGTRDHLDVVRLGPLRPGMNTGRRVQGSEDWPCVSGSPPASPRSRPIASRSSARRVVQARARTRRESACGRSLRAQGPVRSPTSANGPPTHWVPAPVTQTEVGEPLRGTPSRPGVARTKPFVQACIPGVEQCVQIGRSRGDPAEVPHRHRRAADSTSPRPASSFSVSVSRPTAAHTPEMMPIGNVRGTDEDVLPEKHLVVLVDEGERRSISSRSDIAERSGRFRRRPFTSSSYRFTSEGQVS